MIVFPLRNVAALRHCGNLLGVYFLSLIVMSAPIPVSASMSDGTILSGAGRGYSWSTYAGYMNWLTSGGNVHVGDSGLTGYVWDPNYGWMNLDPQHAGVTLDSTTGALGGWAWSSGAGWVDFSGASINTSTGRFQGMTATNTYYGNINFECANCDVVTDWRPPSARAATSSSGITAGNMRSRVSGSISVNSALIHAITPADTQVSQLPEGMNDGLVSGSVIKANVGGTVSEAAENLSNRRSLSRDEAVIRATELFDIYFFAERKTIARSRDLVTRTTFDSFGSGPATASMTFIVHDMTGKELYKREATTTVETQGLYVKRYLDLNIPDGKYRIEMKVKYRAEGEDDFSIPFIVDGGLATKEGTRRFILELLLLLFPILYALYFGIIDRRNLPRDVMSDGAHARSADNHR